MNSIVTGFVCSSKCSLQISGNYDTKEKEPLLVRLRFVSIKSPTLGSSPCKPYQDPIGPIE